MGRPAIFQVVTTLTIVGEFEDDFIVVFRVGDVESRVFDGMESDGLHGSDVASVGVAFRAGAHHLDGDGVFLEPNVLGADFAVVLLLLLLLVALYRLSVG